MTINMKTPTDTAIATLKRAQKLVDALAALPVGDAMDLAYSPQGGNIDLSIRTSLDISGIQLRVMACLRRLEEL